MAYIQDRRVEVGELLSGTFAELGRIKKELAVYFGVFLIAGLLADLIEPVRGGVGAAAFFGYFAGQYYLYRAVMRSGGGGPPIEYDPGFKVFSLFFMACVLIFPISIGANFFIIPGILLAAKWIMAPAFLVSEEMNLFDAIGASWRASSGNTLALSAVFTIIFVVWMFVFGIGSNLLGGLGDRVGSGEGPNTFGWLLLHLLPVFLIGLSVSAYRALSDRENDYLSVFE